MQKSFTKIVSLLDFSLVSKLIKYLYPNLSLYIESSEHNLSLSILFSKLIVFIITFNLLSIIAIELTLPISVLLFWISYTNKSLSLISEPPVVEIEVDKNRRKIATSILDYINKYGNGQYNLETTAKNKNNRISTLAISIENNNAQVEKRILKSIIENNNEVEIQNIGKELLKKIDECMFEQVTRSCKFELDAKLENDVSEDQFINEMYKKIVEKLKLDNVKDIKTINKKTEIIFESSEKLDIESNGKDRMDDYIKNSKLIKENSQSQENISKDKLKEEIIKEEEEVL